MRPWVDAAAALPFAAFPIEDAAGGVCSGDFLRAGNLSSLAVEERLEIDSKVGLHEFLARVSVVAEDEMICGGLIEGRRENCSPLLCATGREYCFAGTSGQELGVLFVVQQEEFHVGALLGPRATRFYKRVVGSAQLRIGSMSRDFKGQSHNLDHSESFTEDGLAATHRRSAHLIGSRRPV